jgi:hypothetical protein
MAEDDLTDIPDDGELALVSVKCTVLTEDGVRRRLSKAVAQVGSASEYCRIHSLSEDYVRQVINGRRPPGGKILVTLGLERRVFYCEVASDDGGEIKDLLIRSPTPST